MRLRILMAVTWTALILIATLIPASWLSQAAVPETGGVFDLVKDKIVHGVLFLMFALTWSFALRPDGRPGLVLTAGLSLAILTEWLQGLPVIGRATEPMDALADVVGLVIGLIAYRLVSSRTAQPAAPSVAAEAP